MLIMIKKVRISEKRSEINVSEYVVMLDNEATNEEYCDLAWEYAIDEFAVDPDRRLRYRFAVSDCIVH